MGKCFTLWCQTTPEIGPPPLGLPDPNLVYDILQLVKHVATDSAARDRKLLQDMKQFAQHQDAKWGGHSKAYRQMRDGWIGPFETLAKHEFRDVIVTDNQDGTYQVWCDQPQAFSACQLLQVSDHYCSYVSQDAYSLQVRPNQPVDLTQEDTLSQTYEIHEPSQIFHDLQQFWKPFWEREPNLEPDPHMQHLLSLIPEDFPPAAVDVHDISLWTAAISALKVPCARGVDAISTQELKMLPLDAVVHLRDVLTSYQTGFPTWFMMALTCPVPKVPETPLVGQIRPITLLAQLYRLWSRVICKQLLKHLSSQTPEPLTGLLQSRGPLDSVMRQQFYIEQCHHLSLPASGLSLDLVKCYNTVHRTRIYEAMLALRLPASVVDQWYHSLQVLSRVWTCQGFCSTVTPTTTGLPEGDSFSVVGMVVLDYLWILAVQACATDPFLAAYADNLGWASQSPQEHPAILHATQMFTSSFGMQIDWTKTWCWGTSHQLAQELQQCVRTHVPAARLTTQRSAMDLGAQMTYHGPPVLGHFRRRLVTAQRRLVRLRSLKMPLKSKALLYMGGVLPVAFYGVSILPVGLTHIDHLRPKCADALLGHAASRNSALALAVIPGAQDPLVYVLMQVLRIARRFLLRLPDAQRTMFFRVACQHDGLAHHVKGPAGTLTYWLHKIGWKISSDGFIDVHVHAFCRLPLCETSNATFLRWVQREWQQEVTQFHCRRKAISHVAFDLVRTKQLISQFPTPQQPALINELAGAFQTEHQKHSWAGDSDGNCPHCQQPDTKEHRFYDCPATHHVREEFHPLLLAIREDGCIYHELPALPALPEEELLLAIHHRHPEATIAEPAYTQLMQLQSQHICLQFFTDGSLQHPETQTSRYAAYAVVIDLALSDEERIRHVQAWKMTGVRPQTFHTLMVARTTGDQRIHRSELYAVVRICELFVYAHIHSDSSSTIAVFGRCETAAHPAVLATLEDFDLVQRLWHAQRKGRFTISKVKAHVGTSVRMTSLACYHTWGNEAANQAAIDTCRNMHPEVVVLSEEVHAQAIRDRSRLHDIFQMHLNMHVARAVLDSSRVVSLPHEEVRTATGPTPVQILSEWTVSTAWTVPAVRTAYLAKCAWGPQLTHALLAWMLKFVWPSEQATSLQDPGVTFAELMLSFHFETGMVPPVRRERGAAGEFLQPLMSAQDVELYTVTISEMASAFATWLAQARKLAQPDPWPSFAYGPCRSVYRIGGSMQSRGVQTRPMFPHQAAVVAFLAKEVRRCDTLHCVPSLEVTALPQGALAHFDDPWTRLQKRASVGIKEANRRLAGIAPLTFRSQSDAAPS